MPGLWAFLLFSLGIWLWGKLGAWSLLGLGLPLLAFRWPRALYGGFLGLGALAAFLSARPFPDRFNAPGRRIILLEPLDTARARVLGLWEDGEFIRSSGTLTLRGRWLSPRERYWVAGFAKADTLFFRRWARVERFEALKPLRNWVRRAVERGSPSPEAEGLALAFLLGDRSRIPRELKRAFRETGMMHLLAISGLHVGILFGVFALLLSWLGKGRAFAASLGLVWAYALLAGANPPVLRASVAATAFVAAYLSGREFEPLNALGVAGLLCLALNPSWLKSLSFQMSFLATAGILLHARFRWGPHRLRAFVGALLATAGAQAWVLPILLNAFGSFSWWVFLLNFAAVPLLSAALGSWVLALLTAPVPLLGQAYAAAAGELTHLLAELVSWAASAVPAQVRVPFPGWLVPLWYAGLVALGVLQRRLR